MTYYGDVDWYDMRRRILNLLTTKGQLRTPEIVDALSWSCSPRAIRKTIQFLKEEKKIKQKNREHPWELSGQ